MDMTIAMTLFMAVAIAGALWAAVSHARLLR
jgi:hypothetical protein